MKTYRSQTVNGGKTIILDHVTEALTIGNQYVLRVIDRFESGPRDKEIQCGTVQRNATCEHCGEARADHKIEREKDDHGKATGATKYLCKEAEFKSALAKGDENLDHLSCELCSKKYKHHHIDKDGTRRCITLEFKAPESRSQTITNGEMLAYYQRLKERLDTCEHAITAGDAELKEHIAELTDELRDLITEIQPQLSAGYSGFSRSEEGVDISPELLAAGDDRPCFRRKEGSDQIRSGAGEGAYRVIISTDVEWWGQPHDNAALIGALVVCLQQFKPVEVWIQQGWLGEMPNDGITLFKLDFTGAFEPTALAFWLGHADKDECFSYCVNRGMMRHGENSATTAELECDLFLRGDWMKAKGIDPYQFRHMLHTDKVDIMARWVAETAMRVVFGDETEASIEV